MSIMKNRIRPRLHYKCLLCPIVTANRGAHLEKHHDSQLDRFEVRGMIGSDQQDSYFSKYFVQTEEPTSSQLNQINYESQMGYGFSLKRNLKI